MCVCIETAIVEWLWCTERKCSCIEISRAQQGHCEPFWNGVTLVLKEPEIVSVLALDDIQMCLCACQTALSCWFKGLKLIICVTRIVRHGACFCQHHPPWHRNVIKTTDLFLQPNLPVGVSLGFLSYSEANKLCFRMKNVYTGNHKLELDNDTSHLPFFGETIVHIDA